MSSDHPSAPSWSRERRDSGERPSARALALAPTRPPDDIVAQLRARAERLASPGGGRAYDLRDRCKLLAIDVWKRAVAAIGPDRTDAARVLEVDEGLLREWERLGARNSLQAWAFFALPREAKLVIIHALMDSIEQQHAPEVRRDAG